ncbi:glycoside hydrolase [Aureisphaera galaxeae]|uniref:glycoside hydrolase family 113 n=1 Tax=Aureisphaera galaxeae TaxID=1538023 RepID=UPI0023502DBA|nr:glycoside hydrolase [Aureisphaera galaxeae]MDC8002963.1 glycoside hydrolase [Aureisphaera galaxeae]
MRVLKILLLLILLQSCEAQNSRINGVSFVASPKKATQIHVDPVVAIKANYAAVMPFGFIRNLESPEIIYNTDRQWYGETRDGAAQYIDILKTNGIKVMLKPQIWIWRGEFTGYLKMKSEEDWKVLEDSYRTFILDYARLAQEKQVALFCIGTELEQFIMNRSDFWSQLIVEIKEIYKGDLTYAANWDEYKRVPFWKELDYVGVDAYFPVSDSVTPTFEEAVEGWKPWLEEMEGISTTHGKPVLFTEYGYRSVDYAGKEPWRSDRSMTEVNLDAQVNLTKALYEVMYEKEWFKGGFIWKWFIDYNGSGGSENSQFTPQNKPVEQVLKQYYENNR